MSPEIEDVPELMQRIQSRLPVKEAACSSVLSKSWLHAWSTIPNLRFDVRRTTQLKLDDVDRTLTRYLHDNTPIETFELKIDMENQDSASHAEKLIGSVATRTCLKEISLSIIPLGALLFMFPDEILASQNLTKIRLLSPARFLRSVWMPTPLIINCVSLRELRLDGVFMSEETLHVILSSCRLLERIELLYCCKGFNTIKVTNLPRLYELGISLEYDDDDGGGGGVTTTLEITNVPNLEMFSYNLHISEPQMPVIPFSDHSISLGSVTELMLGGVITDKACLDKIKSGFPFLERLTLHMTSWKLGSFCFLCVSLKRLSLLLCPSGLTKVKVYAPKLRFFEFGGDTLPSLLFPVSKILKQTKVSLSLNLPVDIIFFLRMREVLALSRKCYLRISTDNSKPPLDINIGDLRAGLAFPPATNVQELCFGTSGDECLWERSLFFDAFFEICHPKHVIAKRDALFSHKNHFCRLMLREVLLEKKTTTQNAYSWPHYLKHVQIRQSDDQNWETLTNSHTGFLDGSVAPGLCMHFNLNWGGVS